LPVAYGAGVGGLGLFGELAFGLALALTARCRVAPAFVAGGVLELAQLFACQRRLGVGVVLAAGEQAPERAGELAGAGDDGDLVTAARADALVEGAQRAGLPDRAPACLDERPARRA
jgi:hypothetical protein